MVDNLYTTKWKGIPVLFHWSVLLFVPWYWFHHHSFSGALVALPAYVFLIFAHEAGHAYVARLRQTRVKSIRIYILHGLCVHELPHYEEDDIYISWGGVLAQLSVFLLVVISLPLLRLFPQPIQDFIYPAFYVFTYVNIGTVIINLLPIPPLDGAKAWRIFPYLRPLMHELREAMKVRLGKLSSRHRKALKASSEKTAADILKRLQQR